MSKHLVIDLEDQFISWCAKSNNLPSSYIKYFGEGLRSKAEFDELKEKYEKSFGINNVFEVDFDNIGATISQIEKNCKESAKASDLSFENYSQKKETRIPHAILNTHFIAFIKSLIRMGNDEFILYIRKNYQNNNTITSQLGKSIWIWLRDNANGQKIGERKNCEWGEEADNVAPEKLPYTATQFLFERAYLPKLYDYLDELGRKQIQLL